MTKQDTMKPDVTREQIEQVLCRQFGCDEYDTLRQILFVFAGPQVADALERQLQHYPSEKGEVKQG